MDLWRIPRVLWAQRAIILTAMASCFLGGVVVIETSQPRYEATARVELEIIKPDPVTGFHITSKNSAAYVGAQVQMIRDYQVTVRVAQALGWLDSPDLQAAYASRADGQDMDFEHWVALRVASGTGAKVIQDSNILEIKYRAVSPEVARLVVDAIRTAYIEATIDTKRQSAAASSAALDAGTKRIRIKLAELETAKGQYERESGILLQDNNIDMESDRLQNMATDIRAPALVKQTALASASAMQLAQIDSLLGTALKTLGPNNPTLLRLKQERVFLESQVAKERAATGQASGVAAGAARARAGLMAGQIEKIISQHDKLTRLRLMQDEITRNVKQYGQLAAHSVEQQQISNIANGGAIPIGDPVSPTKPAFPNKPLILGGALLLGFVGGGLIAALAELMGRRVRAASDLQVVGGSTFMVVPQFNTLKAKRRGFFVRGWQPLARDGKMNEA